VDRLVQERPHKGVVRYMFMGDPAELDDPSLLRADREAALSIAFEGASWGDLDIMAYKEPQEFGALLGNVGLPWAARYRPLAGPQLLEAFYLLVPVSAGIGVKEILRLVGIWLSHRNEREVEIRARDGTMVRIKGAGADLREAEQELRRLLGRDIGS